MKFKKPKIIDRALMGCGLKETELVESDDGIEKLKKMTEILSGEGSWELDITQLFFSSNREDLYRNIVPVLLRIFDSEYGTFGYIGKNGDSIQLSSTPMLGKKCKMKDQGIVFSKKSMKKMHLWSDAYNPPHNFVICNNGSEIKTPKGHVELERVMIAPILYKNCLVGMMAVSNKKTDYTESDQSLFESIAGFIAPMLKVRRKLNDVR
jgi:hypothetical protein